MSAAHELPSASELQDLCGITWDEYLRMEDPPGFRLEFEQGRLIVSPTGRFYHGRICTILVGVLRDYERKTQSCIVVSEQSFFMPPGERDFRPDVAVVTDGRRIDADGWGEGAPDIVIEVLSPSTERRDRNFKAARYYEQGADELWFFDPKDDTAEFYRRTPDGWLRYDCAGEYETPELPGFTLNVADVFREAGRGLDR